MTLYSLALFVHIVGALMLFTAFTSEGITLFQLRRATTVAQVREWEGVAALARIFGPASVVTILASGLYMMFSTWGWVSWIAVGLVAWFLVAVAGAVNGIRLSLVMRHITPDGAGLGGLKVRSFVISWLARLAVGLGIVFVMTDKPDLVWGIVCIGVAAAVGASAGAFVSHETGAK